MYFAFISIGAVGHVLPTLPLIAELVRRGVRVSYFTSENLREAVSATGAEFHPVATFLGQEKDDIEVDMMAELPLRFLSEAESAIAQILSVLEKDVPDVVLSDALAVAGRLAAAALKRPLVRVFTSYASNDVFSVAATFPFVPDTHPARVKASALADRFTALYGVEHLGVREIFEGAADYNLVMLQREFQPAGESFGDNFFFAGAQVAPRVGDGGWRAPENGRPVVYASLGTVFNNNPAFFRMLFDAVADMPVNLVAAIGHTIPIETLEPIPPNVSAAAFQPQLDILGKASLFITHAGTGSVMEAIYFGVPMIAVPQMDEQCLTARRMAELGLGVALDDRDKITVERLKKEIAFVLGSAEIHASMARMQSDMRQNSGCGAAADRLLAFADACGKDDEK